MKRNPIPVERSGAIAPFVAVLIIILLGMVAFAVDVGWIVLTKHQLQNAADSAAMAGVDPLMDGYIQYQLAKTDSARAAVLSSYLDAARKLAKQFADHNSAGGVSNLTLSDDDIEFGITDASYNYTPLASNGGFPNTIRVKLRRDSTENGALNLFFAPVLGTRSVDLTASSAAVTMGRVINNFKNTSPENRALLPVTYDVEHWRGFLQTGEDPDGNVSTAADGSPTLLIYPSIKYKGNFGELALDDEHSGTSEIFDWIRNGLTSEDINVLQSRNLIPLSNHDPNLWDWRGNNGFRASMVMEINARVGQVFALPLYKAKNPGTGSGSGGNGNGGSSNNDYEAGVGQGSHYDYNIVEFVGVRIMPVDKTNREIIVQPAAYVDPFVQFNSLQPVGTTETLITTFTTPKLIRR